MPRLCTLRPDESVYTGLISKHPAAPVHVHHQRRPNVRLRNVQPSGNLTVIESRNTNFLDARDTFRLPSERL